ncbi:MAG: acyl carrier protein [Bacteroidales bacterium]|nr:acyl carrier protein [Bacteroidales bacterium]
MKGKDILASWQKIPEQTHYPDPDEIGNEATPENVEKWLIAWLSNKLKISPGSIDKNKSIMSYGLDSMGAVELERDVQKKFDVEMSITDFLENNSINELKRIGLKERV